MLPRTKYCQTQRRPQSRPSQSVASSVSPGTVPRHSSRPRRGPVVACFGSDSLRAMVRMIPEPAPTISSPSTPALSQGRHESPETTTAQIVPHGLFPTPIPVASDSPPADPDDPLALPVIRAPLAPMQNLRAHDKSGLFVGTMRVFKEAWGRICIIFVLSRCAAPQTLLLSPTLRVLFIVISELFEMYAVPLGKVCAVRT
jgi:hypothetical protein